MIKYLLVILFSFNYCFGQIDTVKTEKWNYGINLGTNLDNLFDPSITPSFVMTKGLNYFSVGPKIFFNYTYKPLGFDFNYRHRINKTSKKVNIYLLSLVELEYQKYTFRQSAMDFIGNKLYYIDHIEKYSYLKLFLGCGIDFKVMKRFHINSSIGIGPVFCRYNFTETVETNPSENKNNVSGFLQNIFPIVMFNFGIGFDISRLTNR